MTTSIATDGGIVSLVDDVIQVAGCRRLQRLEAEIIQDQQVGAEIALQTSVIGAVGTSAIEMLEHLVDGSEEGIEALTTCFMDKRLGQMGFETASQPPNDRVCPTSAVLLDLAS